MTIQEAHHLSELMNSSNVDAIVSELNQLHLLPKTLSMEQAKELVRGRYGQTICQQPQKISYSNQLNDSDWKENFNCLINGTGIDSYFMPLRTYRFLEVVDWLLYYFVTCPGIDLANILSLGGRLFFICIIVEGIFCFPQAILESYWLYTGQFINPIKLTSGKIFIDLFDQSWEQENLPYLYTSGTNGTWSIENYSGISLYIENFYGIWLIFHESGDHGFGAHIRGYCSEIHAKGREHFYTRPEFWGDEPWPWP